MTNRSSGWIVFVLSSTIGAGTARLCALAAVLTACSDQQTSVRYVNVADATRVAPLAVPKGPAANVVVRRVPSIGLWNAHSVFLLDGAKVVTLLPGEQYQFAVQAGPHVVSAVCEVQGYGGFRNELAFAAQTAQTHVFRLVSSTTDNCLIVPVPAQAAAR